MEKIGYIEIMGSITLTGIETNNSEASKNGLKYLNKMFDKSLGTSIEETIKKTIHYQIKRIMEKTNEDHPLWKNLEELMEKTK